MIKIEHVYTTHVYINYYHNDEPWRLDERMVDTMDAIAEHVCEVLVKHNFTSADVCDAQTGEVLIMITRS